MLLGRHPFQDQIPKNSSDKEINLWIFKRLERDFKQGFVLEGNFHPFFKIVVPLMLAYEEEDRISFHSLSKQMKLL